MGARSYEASAEYGPTGTRCRVKTFAPTRVREWSKPRSQGDELWHRLLEANALELGDATDLPKGGVLDGGARCDVTIRYARAKTQVMHDFTFYSDSESSHTNPSYAAIMDALESFAEVETRYRIGPSLRGRQ
jgi:hypothetical protein